MSAPTSCLSAVVVASLIGIQHCPRITTSASLIRVKLDAENVANPLLERNQEAALRVGGDSTCTASLVSVCHNTALGDALLKYDGVHIF